MIKPFNKNKPINIAEQAHRHFMVAVSAHVQACEGEELGTVAAKHVREIARRHSLISKRLDAIAEAHEKASVKR